MSRQSKAETVKEKKLSTEIARKVSLVLTGVFVCMIAAALFFSGRSILKAVDGEFQTDAAAAGSKVENILQSAGTAAESVNAYLEKAYKESAEGKGEEQTGTVYRSSIYNKQITAVSSGVEDYITEVIRQTVKNNSDIIGMGALFEPYAFDTNIKDYAFYIMEDRADEAIEPYGAYDSYSVEEFYAKAKNAMVPQFTKPYEDQGVNMITYSVPIVYDGELKGVITADINITNFDKVFSKNDNYPSKYVDIISDEGVVIYDSDSDENVGASLEDFIGAEYVSEIKEKMEGDSFFSITIRRSDGISESCYYSPIITGDIKWWALTALKKSEQNKSLYTTLILLLVITVASLILVTGVVYNLLRKLLQPIQHVVEAAENIAEGNLNLELKAESNDEIGRLANAFQRTVVSLRSLIEDETILLTEMAEGNFNVSSHAAESYKGDFRPILVALNGINERLGTALGEINESSTQVAAASEQMANAAQTLAEGSGEQASAVEELLASVNEVAAQVQKNAQDASAASENANRVGGFAKESNRQMEHMTGAMNKISETSSQIVAIIGAIEDIAS